MKTIRTACSLLLLSTAVACSSSSGSPSANGDSANDAGATGDDDDGGLSTGETESFGTSSNSLATNQETTTLANALFDFDPTIDPSADAPTNATNVGQHTTTSLGGCGSVAVNGASVTVNFGAAPGCTLSGGEQISGSVNLALSKSMATTSIALTMTNLDVNGQAIAGTATFATSDGSTFAVTSQTSSSTKTETSNLTIVGAASSFTISGSAQVTEDGVSSVLAFNDVVHVDGECYATSGSMTVTTGPIVETITFNANTPATGEVSVQTGKHTTSSTLMPYGSCPSDANEPSDAGDAGGRGRDGGLGH